MNETINLALSTGASIPMRPYTTKAGGLAYGIMPKGATKAKAVKVNKSVLGGTMPKHLTVKGVKVQAKTGTNDKGQPKAVFSTLIDLNGATKRCTFWVHDEGTHFKVGGGIITAVGGAGSVIHDEL